MSTVATHEYSVWTDSGIRGQSEADVRPALPKAHLACQVRYNPQKPEVSVADCQTTARRMFHGPAARNSNNTIKPATTPNTSVADNLPRLGRQFLTHV